MTFLYIFYFLKILFEEKYKSVYMPRMKNVVPVLICILLLMPVTCFAQSRYAIGIKSYHSNSSLQEIEMILQEAYARIGMQVSFSYLPPKRVMQEVQTGKLDACGLMGKDHIQFYPHMKCVPVPIFTVSMVAFTMPSAPRIMSWNDVSGLTVGILRGSTLISDNVINELDTKVFYLNDAASGLQMLQEKRIDCLLGGATAGSLLAESIGVDVVFSPPLATIDMYHTVHKDHEDKVGQLTDALLAMQKDGTIEQMSGRFKPMLPSN